MKRFLIASSLGFALATGSALAADMPVKAPAPLPVPVANWTGCYLDGGVGYGFWNQDHNGESFPGLVPATVSYTQGGRGWLGRVGGGCDVQVTPRWVIGAFGDYDFMHVHAGFAPGDLAIQGDSNESGAWAVGGRIGYLVTPNLLTFFDGGYTQTRFDQVNLSSLNAVAVPATFIPSTTYHGWFLGGGTEYALNYDWIPIKGLFWRNEYRWSNYSSVDNPVTSIATGAPITAAGCSATLAAATPCGEHITPYVQTITSSLVWRFNWGGPVTTRY